MSHMKFIITALLFIFVINSQAQDTYHTQLLEELTDNYGLSNSEYLFTSTENGNLTARYNYGNANVQDSDIANLSFSKLTTVDVLGVGNNQWDIGMGNRIQESISDQDIVLVTFWARRNSEDSELFLFAEDVNSFEKEYYISVGLTPDWTQYFIAFEASKNYVINEMAIGFHFGAQIQNIEIGGFTALNYNDQYPLDQVPSSFSTFGYEGMEEDAQWRVDANARIETNRKANLTINISDMNGDPVQGAVVEVKQIAHEFGFGSAIVPSRFPGNDATLSIYTDKILDLDGEGHGFNVAVTENALKWDGWEDEWIGSPEETASAIQWLSDNNITTRGHTLIWPGFQYMPDDIAANQNDLSYLRNRINGRIETMLNHPVIGELITEWDVLNEIAVNRDLEGAFMADPNYNTGREVYEEILSKVKDTNPATKMYINDYVVLSGGGSGNNVINRYKQFLDELDANPTDFDGIGFQAHIGAQPTSIIKLLDVLQDFSTRYNKRIKITEFDMNELIDGDIQRMYMEDFLTASFSHDYVDAFIMWGFWDGNHWKQNAPMFDLQWNIKPAGEGFIQKVFNDWWTEEMTLSDDGAASIRAFKGKHRITVSYNGQEKIIETTLSEDQNIDVQLDEVVSVENILNSVFTISPNPATSGLITISYPTDIQDVSARIFSANGKEVATPFNIKSDNALQIDIASGIYFIAINSDRGNITKRIIIE